MPEIKSDQIEQYEAQGHAPLKANELYGRQRHNYAKYTVKAADAQNDVLRLCSVPKGALIISSFILIGAAGSSTTAEIGLQAGAGDSSGNIEDADTSAGTSAVANDPDFFGTIADTSSATSTEFGNTTASKFAYETKKEVDVILSLKGADWDADTVIEASVGYVVD